MLQNNKQRCGERPGSAHIWLEGWGRFQKVIAFEMSLKGWLKIEITELPECKSNTHCRKLEKKRNIF